MTGGVFIDQLKWVEGNPLEIICIWTCTLGAPGIWWRGGSMMILKPPKKKIWREKEWRGFRWIEIEWLKLMFCVEMSWDGLRNCCSCYTIHVFQLLTFDCSISGTAATFWSVWSCAGWGSVTWWHRVTSQDILMGRPGLKSFAMKTVTITSFHWRIWAKKFEVNFEVFPKKIELPTSNCYKNHQQKIQWAVTNWSPSHLPTRGFHVPGSIASGDETMGNHHHLGGTTAFPRLKMVLISKES